MVELSMTVVEAPPFRLTVEPRHQTASLCPCCNAINRRFVL